MDSTLFDYVPGSSHFIFADGHYVGLGFVGDDQARRLNGLKGLRLVQTNLAPPSFPYVPVLPGLIHGYCPKCGTELHNMERFEGDPVEAVWYQILCRKCGGMSWRTGVFLDADGEPVGMVA